MTTITTMKKASAALRTAAENYSHELNSGDPITIALRPGQMFCQGDIGILCMKAMPLEAHQCDRPTGGQVAPGTSKGSRHCIAEPVQFYHVDDDDPLSDLCVETTEAWTMTHPEHAYVTCGPGLYRLVHQQNEQRQRVVD